MDGRALYRHVTGLEADVDAVVQLQNDFAGHDDGVIDGLRSMDARADPRFIFGDTKYGPVVEGGSNVHVPHVPVPVDTGGQGIRRPNQRALQAFPRAFHAGRRSVIQDDGLAVFIMSGNDASNLECHESLLS